MFEEFSVGRGGAEVATVAYSFVYLVYFVFRNPVHVNKSVNRSGRN